MFDVIREDLQRHGPGFRRQLRALLFIPALWAVVGYRFAHWVERASVPRSLRKALRLLAMLASLGVDVATNIEIPASAEIGPGLYIAHTGYIVIAPGVRMGRHCTLTHGVTIGHGTGGASDDEGCPVLGDRVYLGPGSAVIGPITIGSDALIGVGAIVVRDVPRRGVALGNPAHVIARTGSFDLITYDGCERDPDRLAARAEAAADMVASRTRIPLSTQSGPRAEARTV